MLLCCPGSISKGLSGQAVWSQIQAGSQCTFCSARRAIKRPGRGPLLAAAPVYVKYDSDGEWVLMWIGPPMPRVWALRTIPS